MTVVEVKEIIRDTVTKAICNNHNDVIKPNDILMSGPNFTTVVEVKKNIHRTITVSWQPMSQC